MIKKFFLSISKRSRFKRAQVFRKSFEITPETKILDLGSENGSHINYVLCDLNVDPQNVYIADIKATAIKDGSKKYGYTPVFIEENGLLDFPDKYFDIVFCSSVIEHVTIDKSDVWKQMPNEKFKTVSKKNQKEFAYEIRRLAKRYFVQTPCKSYFIESHTWLPLISYFPRNIQSAIIRISNKFWIKHTTPDWNLLSIDDMKELFPDSEIIKETQMGFCKSIIAIR